ncbi:MAG: rhomboid family intramembrane serine protease [Oscillospiraceae bacterium]|nr:rhomboid family intramembrane serine protease [Oscillospiraceae bacterium]MBR6419593.1 rhomboid family intramembrane serine protease [Oscillospiraceae bacterium]
MNMKIKMPKFQYNAPVILTMTIVSAVALVLNYLTGGWSNHALFSVYRCSLASPLTYLRFFTFVLGHVNYTHYINNFTMILLVGPMIEEKYGSKQLLEMIAITALVTGLIQFIFFPKEAGLGASGILFMMILLSSYANYKKGYIPITLILVAIFYLTGEIINAVAKPNDGISQMAHIIGGLCGMLFGWVIANPKEEAEKPAEITDLKI